MPDRIQLKRSRGWRLPARAMSVARPGRWGNFFVVGAKVIAPGQWGTAANPYRENLPVGRYTRPDGTPYEIRLVRDRADAVMLYADYKAKTVRHRTQLDHYRRELGGRDLACWCPLPEPGQPDICHGAVLLEIANSRPGELSNEDDEEELRLTMLGISQGRFPGAMGVDMVHLGDACPNDCQVREYPGGREEPERIVEALPGSGDGELVCPTCWDAWNSLNPAQDQQR